MAQRRTKRTELVLDDKTIDEAIQSLVERFPDGILRTKIPKELPALYKAPVSRIKSRVEALLHKRVIFAWNKSVVAPSQFEDRVHTLLELMQDLSTPKTQKQIETQLPSTMRSLKKELKKILDEQVERRRLFEHPDPRTLNRKNPIVRYSSVPAKAAPYLASIEKEIAKVLKQLQRTGIDRRALVAALSGAPIVSGVVQSTDSKSNEFDAQGLMRAILAVRPDAKQRVLVSIPDVRRHLDWPKLEFDRLVLGLASRGDLALHYHDHAFGMSQSERDELVTDGVGNFYIGMVLEGRSEQASAGQ